MAFSQTKTKAIELGKQLVQQLGCDPRDDTLSRWMAHYVAEQIVAAENSKGKAKVAAQKECLKTIMSLWEHRASLPDGRRPLQKFDPVLRALAAIDPKAKRPFYHLFPAREQQSKIKPGLIEFWADFILKVDVIARVLIQTALDEACELAADQHTRTLLKKAIPTAGDGDIESFRIMLTRADESANPAMMVIQERIQKLNAFSEVSRVDSDILQKKLNGIRAQAKPKRLTKGSPSIRFENRDPAE